MISMRLACGCFDVEAQQMHVNERVSDVDVELYIVNDSALLILANLLDVERKWAFLENVEMYKDKYIELSSLCGVVSMWHF